LKATAVRRIGDDAKESTGMAMRVIERTLRRIFRTMVADIAAVVS
jgi:hypothetical protein